MQEIREYFQSVMYCLQPFLPFTGVRRLSYELLSTGKTILQPASPSSRVLMDYLGLISIAGLPGSRRTAKAKPPSVGHPARFR